MSQTLRLGPFRGLRSALGGDAPVGYAGDLLNVRVGDGHIRPRYGFRNLAAPPVGLTAVLGFARLLGYDDAYQERLEWVSIENRGGTVRPYAIDPATWVRTQITSGGEALSLASGDWLAFTFAGYSYWINPGGTPSVYLHQVGDATSWTALQDQAYAAPPVDPSFRVDVDAPFQYLFGLAGDSVSISGSGVASPTSIVNEDSSLTVSGRAGNDSQNSANSVVTLTFGTPQDFSIVDYQGFLCKGEDVYIRFKTGVMLEVQIGGAWSKPEQVPFLSQDRTKTGVVARLKGVAGAGAVQAIRMTLRAEPQPHHSGKAYTILPYDLGGSYLGATLLGDRPWDASYKAADVAYAARYRDVAAGTVTGIKQATKDAGDFGRSWLDGTLPGSVLGDRVTLEIDPLTTGGYVDDPAGTAYEIEYLRLDGAGAWHVLGTAPNTTGQSWRDHLEERELRALATTTVVGYVAPTPAPVFSSAGFVGAVPFKGWVVWFGAGGKGNVQHSRVGNATSLSSASDTSDDLARAATFTLADDFADEPMGGVQAGDALLIVGRQGVYGQSGNSPAAMTPPRKLPGSMGCAGRFAFARFRDDNGDPGLAWLDVSGESVWFAATQLVYSLDTQARPSEISQPIRGSVRSFLLTGQTGDFPGLSLSKVRMEVDEATQTLWVTLGARALVLRPPSLEDGTRQWERYRFALGTWMPYVPPVTLCLPPYSSSAFSSMARAGATLAWSDPQGAQIGDDVALAGPFDPGDSSQWLAGTFVPGAPIPTNAVVYRVTLTVSHRTTPSNAFPVTLSQVQAAGLSASPGVVVPMTFTDYALDLSSLGLSPAAINAGVPAMVAYDAAASSGSSPGDWRIDVAPDSGTSAEGGRYSVGQSPPSISVSETFAVTPVWIGSGASPARVPVRINAEAQASLAPSRGQTAPADALGAPSLDDGFADAVETVRPLGAVLADSSGVHTESLAAGVAYGLSLSASCQPASPNRPYGDPEFYTIDHYGVTVQVLAQVDPTPLASPSVEVRSMALTVCYALP